MNRQMVRRRARAAELPSTVNCHSFRATGITNYLSNRGSLEDARAIAAHADHEEGAVVEIESINVEVGYQRRSLIKTETAVGGGFDPTFESIGVVRTNYHTSSSDV